MATCALCAKAAATIYCVNDDATLCSSCDATFHSNPLTLRHERRGLIVPKAELRATPSAADSGDDAAVVPQFTPVSPAAAPLTMFPSGMFDDIFTFTAPTFMDPAEDAAVPTKDIPAVQEFPSAAEIAQDMLSDFDCVVPSLTEDSLVEAALMDFGAVPMFQNFAPMQTMMIKREAAAPSAAVPVMVPQEQEPECEDTFEDDDYVEEDPSDEEYRVSTRRAARPRRETAIGAFAFSDAPQLTREQRVARYKEKRARRNFRKTIRYQSRKAYAEIRPRIKGRFVSPEEYAAYMATQREGEAVVPAC